MIKKIILALITMGIFSNIFTACDDLKQIGQGVVDESKKEAKKAAGKEIDAKINAAIDSIGINLNQKQKDKIIKKLKENPKSIANTVEIKKIIISSLINSIAKSKGIKLTQEEIQKISELATSYDNYKELAGYITKLVINASKNKLLN